MDFHEFLFQTKLLQQQQQNTDTADIYCNRRTVGKSAEQDTFLFTLSDHVHV